MANTASAQKKVRKDKKRRIVNLSRGTALKTAIKKLMLAMENKEIQNSQALLNDVASKLSRAKSKGLIHRNTASRKLSRLRKNLNKISPQAA